MAKRLKPEQLADEAAFRRTVNAIVALQAQAARIVAAREAAIVAIQDKYAEQLDPIVNVIKAKVALASAYGEAHRSELLTGDKKSVELATAIVGWRTGNRTVAAVGKKYPAVVSIGLMKDQGLGDYIRTVEEIAKDRILADCKDDKTITITKVLQGSTLEMTIPLAEVGLKISQAETFYIEPKTETGDTLKPAEAVA